MAGRRPAVSVAERPAGSGRWSVRWREAGKQREERSYPNEHAALDRADELRERLRKGLPGSREARTIGKLVAFWYDTFVMTDAVQPATRMGYKIDMGRILDTIADESAHTSQGFIREWRDTIAAQYGPRAANKAHSSLSSAYRVGLEAHPPLVDHNPCRGVKRLAEPAQGFVLPSREHVEYLERTAPSPRELAMLMLASRCGLRQSELLGLAWEYVHDSSLRVARVADPVTRRQRNSTKTKRSERRIPMPPSTRRAVEAIRPVRTRKGALVFPSPTDPTRPMARSAWVKTYWYPWREAAAKLAKDESAGKQVWSTLLRLDWKSFRHHAISRWAAGGATITQVSRWSGDSIATIDKHYAYLFDEDESDVMQAID